MSVQKWIEKLVPLDELKDTVKRFPLSVLCALSLFVIGLLLVHDIYKDPEEWLGKLSLTLGCCYFWFGITKIMSESQGWSSVRHFLVSAVVAVGMGVLFFTSSFWAIHAVFILPALLLALMVAPYFTSGDDISMWFFNRQMWFGVIVSYAALIMFAGGLSVALVAINTLFNVKIDGDVYADIWLFASLVLGPIYALSWVPRDFEYTEEDCSDPPGLRFIANWISVPMIFVYLLILYAYFIKITVLTDIPNGHLAYMISGFIGAGVVTYLISWPLRNDGSVQLRLFHKIFFPAILIPVGYHFFAIWERVSAYGITEQRYMLIVSAVWFLMIGVGNSFKGKMPLKAIPMTLAILLAFSSFGPWGGVSVSGYSQMSRLEKILNSHNLIVDGKVQKAEKDLPFDDRKNISSILDYLCRSERDVLVEPMFNIEGKDDWNCYGYDLTKQLGFEHVSRYQIRHTNERFNLYDYNRDFVDVSGYDSLLRNASVYHYENSKKDAWEKEWTDKKNNKILLRFDDNVMSIQINDSDAVKFDAGAFAADKSQYEENNQDLTFDAENENIGVRIVFQSISGKIVDDEYKVESLGFTLVYKVK